MMRAAALFAMLACRGAARAADRPAFLTVLPPLAIKDAFADWDRLLRNSPTRSFPGAEAELQAHCIP